MRVPSFYAALSLGKVVLNSLNEIILGRAAITDPPWLLFKRGLK